MQSIYEDTKLKFDESMGEYKEKIEKLREKLDMDKRNREELTESINKLNRNTTEALEENQKLKKYIGEKTLMADIKKAIDEEDNILLVDEIAFKTEILDKQRKLKEEEEAKLNQNKRLINLKETNAKLMVQKYTFLTF